MKRDEMIEEMIKFVKSTPKEASNYHKMDMLLSRMERLGVLPPENPNISKYVVDNCLSGNYWEEEDEA